MMVKERKWNLIKCSVRTGDGRKRNKDYENKKEGEQGGEKKEQRSCAKQRKQLKHGTC